MSKLSAVQVRWQSAALKVLLHGPGEPGREPWMLAIRASEEIQVAANCTPQAAQGALASLLRIGLVFRAETPEGVFWRPTDAAVRAETLFLAPLAEELAEINARLEGIDKNLDEALYLQAVREKIVKASERGETG